MIDDISLYKTFMAVAEHGQVSAAAKAAGVTQPAISADISKLERKLGAILFVRTSRGMKLTDEGEQLYNGISNAFLYIEAAEDQVMKTTALQRGNLRIGASDMTLKFFLLDYIKNFCEEYPGVRLSVTNNPTPQTLDSLHNGQIDFGVISEGLGTTETDSIGYKTLREIHDVFVCRPDHPLADVKNISTDELREYSLIMLEKNTGTRKFVSSIPGYRSLEPAIELATSDLIIEFALRGMGIASVVYDFAENAIDEGKLVKLDLATPIPPRHFLLAYSKKRPFSAAASKFVEIITKKTDKKGII